MLTITLTQEQALLLIEGLQDWKHVKSTEWQDSFANKTEYREELSQVNLIEVMLCTVTELMQPDRTLFFTLPTLA